MHIISLLEIVLISTVLINFLLNLFNRILKKLLKILDSETGLKWKDFFFISIQLFNC